MSYQSENTLVIESIIQDGYRVLLNRSDLFAAQCKFGTNLISLPNNKFTTEMKNGPIEGRLSKKKLPKFQMRCLKSH